MSRLVRLEIHDPYITFATTLRRLRPAIERAYYAAFAASDASNEALKEYNWGSFGDRGVLGEQVGTILPSDKDPEVLYASAIAEDLYCDLQATIVVLFADDLLQRFAQRLLDKRIGLDGYGPLYRDIHLTSLLRATTNCVRHVSEWEDYPFPYRDLKNAESNDERVAIRNIAVIQQAYGIGKHERVRDFVSWHTVVTIDGLYGTHPPDYQRFESALIEGAKDISRQNPGDSMSQLERALIQSQVGLV